MSEKIKTKSTVRDIKTLDKSAVAMEKVRSMAVKSKDAADLHDADGHSAPESYAHERLTGRTKQTANDGVSAIRQITWRAKARGESGKAARPHGKTADAAGLDKAKQKAGKDSVIKTRKMAAASGVKSKNAAVKSRSRTASRKSPKGIKTYQVQMAKQTVKQQQQAVARIKAAQRAGRAARKAAVAAARAVKALIAAVRSLISAMIAGGWVTVVVLVVIVVIALIAASPLGVFFSNESGGDKSMNEVITELSGEYYAGVERIRTDNPHDEVVIDSSDGMMSVYWEQVLAVFSVKTSQDPENPLDVITMDEEKQDMLRTVLNDMYLMSSSSETTTTEQEVTTTNEDGEEVTETVTVSHTILTIHLVRKTPDEMATQYSFTRDQKLSLAELMDDYYSDMWGYLLGGYTPGGGIREPSKDRIPTGIFSWPLESAGTITSFFGWRDDPFTGEQTYHGGTDISVPNGTPILAAADGTVTVANVTDSYGGGWGYYVRINHNATYDTLYAHCSSIAVRRGEQVRKGQVIAYVGNTGRSTGDHLHWEVYVNGERDDALNYFR